MLDGNENPHLRTLVAYVPVMNAQEEHVPDAAALVTGGNPTHYWDESGIIGKLYDKVLAIDTYAWDVWMVYKPGVRWEDTYPPKPDFGMHQLWLAEHSEEWPKLDTKEFAKIVDGYLAELPSRPPVD